MDKDRIEGKVKDVAGRVQRQAGEWTGDEEAQTEGARKQVEGKVQNTWGKAKDAARDISKDLEHTAKHAKRGEQVKKEEKTDKEEKRDKDAA